MNITIQKAQDELTVEEWIFRLHGSILVLYYYTLQKKATKRHKFRIAELHSRTYPCDNTLKVENVPLPEDVKQRALEAFVAQISVVKQLNN